jgi:hypothetical protein
MNNKCFREAVDRHLQLVETLGDDHPLTLKAMRRAIDLAPPEIQEQLTTNAKELGLIPKQPWGHVDGEPVYRLEDIANTLGISMEEAQQALESMLKEREELGLSNERLLNAGGYAAATPRCLRGKKVELYH